jgi:hypothetical protein
VNVLIKHLLIACEVWNQLMFLMHNDVKAKNVNCSTVLLSGIISICKTGGVNLGEKMEKAIP